MWDPIGIWIDPPNVEDLFLLGTGLTDIVVEIAAESIAPWCLGRWFCWWYLLGGSSQLVSSQYPPIYKPFRPFGRGTTLLRGLTNRGY